MLTSTKRHTTGTGSNNGFLESQSDDDLKISVRFGDGDTISKSIKIRWNVGTIAFDVPNYHPNETAKLQVIDPDMNLNPATLDKVQIHVFSDSDKAGILANAIETQEESGVFETTISFTSDSSSDGNRLFSVIGDLIYAKYMDHTLPMPYNVKDDLDITVESKISTDSVPYTVLTQPNIGVMTWTQSSYFGSENGIIQVIDPDMNLNPDRIDAFSVDVWSESDKGGIDLVLIETDESTGIFEGAVTFTTDDESSEHRLRVSPGNILCIFQCQIHVYVKI